MRPEMRMRVTRDVYMFDRGGKNKNKKMARGVSKNV